MNLSKKHQLKNYVRIFVLLIGVSTLLWNCEKEEIIEPTETVEIQKHPKINVKMVTLEHLQQKEVLNDKLKNIVTALDISKKTSDDNKNNYAQSRITSTDNSFVILTDDILEVTTDSTETYTFRIETPTDATSTFENFVIEKVNGEYVFSITKFVKIEDSEADFPYTMTRQSISEEQINLEDFDDILKNTMHYDASTGCYWYTYSSNALTRGDRWAIFWCPEADSGGGPGGPGDPNDTGNSTDTHDYDNSDPDGNGDNSPGNGGTGTNNTTDPNTADPIIDPNSPIGVLPSIDEIFIDEEFEDSPCLNSIYEDMGKASAFANYLRNFEPEFSVAHLRFGYDENFSENRAQDELDAIAITDAPQHFNIKITFNGDPTLDASIHNKPKLVIAVAFIHEMIHAEIFRKLLSAAKRGDLNSNNMTQLEQVAFVNNLRNNFEGIYDYYLARYKPNAGHEHLAQHYRNTIISAITEYDNNQHSQEVYDAIAWIGLEGTIAWNNLTQLERDNIIQIRTDFIENDTNKCN